jgi:exosome complex component RRP40
MAASIEEKRVVLPGDNIEHLRESESTKKIILGPGLRTEGDHVFACKPGILRFREPNVYWVDTHQKRVSNHDHDENCEVP